MTLTMKKAILIDLGSGLLIVGLVNNFPDKIIKN